MFGIVKLLTEIRDELRAINDRADKASNVDHAAKIQEITDNMMKQFTGGNRGK